jgi:glucose-6-phosphate dehydrogenase assembly protein OpcA
MSGPAPASRGLPVAVGRVDAELRRLWRAAGEGDPDGALTRACVLNLVIVSEAAGEEDLTGVIADVTAQHPCRVLRIDSRPDATPSRLAAFLSAFCRPARKGRQQVCCEEIRLEADGEAARHLHATLAALLSEDLPVFLWWRGQPPFGSHRLQQLADMTDRFIVDTIAAADPVTAVADLARWSAAGGSGAAGGDLAWRRLSPWRDAVAALFDSAGHRALLSAIRHVDLAWGTGASCPGRAQTLYLAGWLTARLGWRLPVAAVSKDPDQVELSLTTPAGMLSMVIHRGAPGDPTLRLEADDAGRGVATARVGCAGEARASLQRPGFPRGERPASATAGDMATTLARELEFRRREPVFAEALARAGDLAVLWQAATNGTSW